VQGCTPRMSWPFLLPYIMENKDNWKHRSKGMLCVTCMYFACKQAEDEREIKIGRCRRHAPTMSGWPVMFLTDWCGDHKLDETKI
jgi:hypothetical protein